MGALCMSEWTEMPRLLELGSEGAYGKGGQRLITLCSKTHGKIALEGQSKVKHSDFKKTV